MGDVEVELLVLFDLGTGKGQWLALHCDSKAGLKVAVKRPVSVSSR
jgi:hypothetical protein